MILSRLRYFAGELFRNLRRQPMLALVSVATVAISLIIVGFFATLWLGADQILDEMAEEVHLTAYLKPGISEQELRDLVAKIRRQPDVERVVFLAAEQDRERNRRLLPRDLIRELPEDLVPGEPCVDVVLRPGSRNRAGVDRAVAFAKDLQGTRTVTSVLSGGEKVQLVFAVVAVVRLCGFIFSVLLLAGAVFFIFTTIRLSIHARKEEIVTRQLMGATPMFVRIPFFLEGAVEGGFGALLAAGTIWLLVGRFNSYLRYAQLIRYEVAFAPPRLVAAFVLGGVLLGLLGSAFALGRYLKRLS